MATEEQAASPAGGTEEDHLYGVCSSVYQARSLTLALGTHIGKGEKEAAVPGGFPMYHLAVSLHLTTPPS